MQSWYQFGYEGFPGGERRRWFYRQRDDPCDSQEDLSNSDENDFGGLDSNSDNDDYWQPFSRRGGRSHPCSSSAYDSGHRQRTARSRRRRKMEKEYSEVCGSDRPIYYYTLREESEEEEGGKENQQQGKGQGPSAMPEWWSEDDSEECEEREAEERTPHHPDDAVRSATTLEVGSSSSVDLLHRPSKSDSHTNSRSPSSSSQNSVDQFFDEDVEDVRMPAEEGIESMVTAVGTTHSASSQHQHPYSHERKKSVVLGSQADVGSASTLPSLSSPSTRHKVATHRHESSPLVRRMTRTMMPAPLGGEERRRVDSYLTTTTHEDPRLLSLFGSSCVSFQIPSSSTLSDCASSASFSSQQTMCAGASVNTGMCCTTEPIESDPITLLVCYGGAPPYTARTGATTTGASNMNRFHSYLPSNTSSSMGSRSTTSSSPSTLSSSSAKVSSAFTIIAVSAESVAAPISVGKTINQVSALDKRNDSPSSSSSPVEGLENVAVHCRPVDTCPAATLTAVADWTRLHPGLRQTNPLLSAAGVAPARVGHCAVALPFSTKEAGYALAAPSSSSVRASPLTSAVSPTLSTPTDSLDVSGSGFRVNNVEVLPVGDGHHEGVEQAQVEEERSCSSGGAVLRSILSTWSVLSSPAGAAAPSYSGDRSLRAHLLLSFVFGGSSALINERHPRVGGSRLLNCRFGGKTVCMPALCVTVVVEDRRSGPSLSYRSKISSTQARSVAPPLTQHQLYFPLLSAPDAVTSGLEPLAFATMTPWPLSSSDSTTNAIPDDMSLRFEKGNRTPMQKSMLSFALLGGTSNGWQPASFSPVTLVHLDVATWAWSTSAWLALGAEPTPRFGHSATLAPKPVPGGGQQIVVFGGIGKNKEYLNDLFVLDTTSRVWREVLCPAPLHYFPTPFQAHRSDVSTPHGRAFHAAVMLPPSHTPGGPTADTTTSSSSALHAGDGKGAKVQEDLTRIVQLLAPAQDLPAEGLAPLEFDAYLNRFILYGQPRSSFLASDPLALCATVSDKDQNIRSTAPKHSDPSFSASGLYKELTTPTLLSTKRRPHRLSPIVIVGGEGEMGLERSVWSVELLFEQEGHIMAQWSRWTFPALRWPRCCTTHRSLITTTDPRGVPRCVLPRVLDGNEQERIKSALSYGIKAETSRQRVTPSRLSCSAGGLTSCTSTCPSEDASAKMEFFASCCGSLPQAVLVGYSRRCSATLQAIPLTHSAGADICCCSPTAKSDGPPSSDSAPPVSYCVSSSSENESWADRDAGVLIFGGTSSLYSSFLTTILTPCGKCLRAEARMKLLSMACARESEAVRSAVEGK